MVDGSAGRGPESVSGTGHLNEGCNASVGRWGHVHNRPTAGESCLAYARVDARPRLGALRIHITLAEASSAVVDL